MFDIDHIGEEDTADTHEKSNIGHPVLTVDALQEKCCFLLSQLEAFQTFLEANNRERAVELKPFKNSVLSELKSLRKLARADPEAEKTIHTLRSSNLPFYTAVWDAAQLFTGLVAFNKRFYWSTESSKSSAREAKKRSAQVDIVAGEGLQWVKVSTITESRLLFEIAKAGWEGADSDNDDENEDQDGVKWLAEGLDRTMLDERQAEYDDYEEDSRVELLKVAEDLQKASNAVRIRYKHPEVCFVLPKIHEGRIPAIDSILDEIRTTGATIRCGYAGRRPYSRGFGTEETHTSLTKEDRVFAQVRTDSLFASLLPSLHPDLTSTVNIDCTLLLALVSDLSHITTPHIPIEPPAHPAIQRQVEIEKKERLLPTSLYPALATRSLITTDHAARRMREIVSLMGTSTERARANILLGEGSDHSKAVDQSKGLQAALAATSDHEIPADLLLPIQVVNCRIDLSGLPPVAERVKAQLTDINQSVFLYGWMRGITTLTSNRSVAKLIEAIVETHGEGSAGPNVWVCQTARSLVGKEKQRRH